MEKKAATRSASPTTVAHVFPSFAMGGQQARFAALAKASGDAFAHHIIALDGEFGARELIEDCARVHYHSLLAQKSSLVSIQNIRYLQRLLRTIEPGILCTYNWGSLEAVFSNALSANAAHIHHEDGFGPGEGATTQPWRRVVARRALLRRAYIVVPSRVLEHIAIEQWKLPRRRVRYVGNGVDLERFAVNETKRHQNDRVIVGSVGALRPEKNYGRLIKSIAGIDGVDVGLEIFGDGPERPALEELARKIGNDPQRILPGATATPEAAYARFDVFALSSDTEQAPFSLMEAMAAGLPVVATDVGDIRAMVSRENRPFVLPIGADGAYGAAIATLVHDGELRQKLGRANREMARQEFGLSAMIENHLSLYREAMLSRG